MAEIVSNSDIFKEQKKYQNVSLRSMEKSVNLLTSIDKTVKSFTKNLENVSLRIRNIGDTIPEKEKKSLKLVTKSILETFRELSKPILSVIQKGFEKLYQTNFVQFFKGLIVQSYREFRDATKPIISSLLKGSKELLSSGYEAGKNFVGSAFELGKNRFLESGPGEFLTKKVSQFKEALGSLKEGSLSALRKGKDSLLKSGPGQFITQKAKGFGESAGILKDLSVKLFGDLKKFSEKGLSPESGVKATNEEKKPEVSALKGIKETLEETLNFWKGLVDKSDDPGSEDAKPSLLSKIFNRKKDEGSSESSSKSSKGKGGSGAAKIGGKLGGLIGGFIGSALGNAIVGFVLAFGNPALFKAAVIFAGTLPFIGAGIGGFIAAVGFIGKFGIDAISESLPKLSESLKTFESLDGDKLSKAAVGIERFFNAFVGGALGGLLSNFTLPDPKDLENLGKSLKQFEGLNAQNVTNSAVALERIFQSLEKASGFKFEQTDIEKLTNLSKVLKSMDENLNGDDLKKIGEGLKPIVDNTQNLKTIEYKVNEGSELGPLGQLGKDLSQFKDVNVDNIKNVGPAIAALGSAFKDTKLGELFGTISNALSKVFGGEQKSLSDQLNEMVTGLSAFEKLDVDKMQRIGPAIKSLGQGLKDASEGLKKDFLSTITSIFGTEDEGKALVDKFTKLSELGEEGVAKRLTDAGLALQKFAFGLQTIGNTKFDNVVKGLELIIEKIKPLTTALRGADFSPEDTLQGVAEGMKMFGEVTIPKESVALQTFLEAVGNGLKHWEFDENITKTLIDLNNEKVLEHIALNAPKFEKFSEMSSTGLVTNFESLGKGLEELADFINDRELEHLHELAKTGILKQLSEVFKPDINIESYNAITHKGIGDVNATRGQQEGKGKGKGNERIIGGETFIPGQPLSKKQMNAIALAEETSASQKAMFDGRSNFDNYPPELIEQYLKQKNSTSSPSRNPVSNSLKNVLGKVDPKKMTIGQTANMSNMPKAFVDNYRARMEKYLNSTSKSMRSRAKMRLRQLDDGRLTATKDKNGQWEFGSVTPSQRGFQNSSTGSPGIVALSGPQYNGSGNSTTNNYYATQHTDAVAQAKKW
jgi:hypothetical protein